MEKAITLSPVAKKLLDKIVFDFKDKLPPEEIFLEKSDCASIIYNLFNGKYDFSYKIYKEVFEYLMSF